MVNKKNLVKIILSVFETLSRERIDINLIRFQHMVSNLITTSHETSESCDWGTDLTFLYFFCFFCRIEAKENLTAQNTPESVLTNLAFEFTYGSEFLTDQRLSLWC